MYRNPKIVRKFASASLPALLLLGCASTYDAQEIEAVRDYIAANELMEVDKIRSYRQINYTYINDQYVTIPARTGDFLVEFKQLCRELSQSEFTMSMVDRRESSTVIRAGFDTIRGCPIGKIYQITALQRDELADLGDAPGDEVFLPDRDDEN